jgi:hypothetical protein
LKKVAADAAQLPKPTLKIRAKNAVAAAAARKVDVDIAAVLNVNAVEASKR